MLNTLFSDKTDFRTMKTVMDEVEHDIVKRKGGGNFYPKLVFRVFVVIFGHAQRGRKVNLVV